MTTMSGGRDNNKGDDDVFLLSPPTSSMSTSRRQANLLSVDSAKESSLSSAAGHGTRWSILEREISNDTSPGPCGIAGNAIRRGCGSAAGGRDAAWRRRRSEPFLGASLQSVVGGGDTERPRATQALLHHLSLALPLALRNDGVGRDDGRYTGNNIEKTAIGQPRGKGQNNITKVHRSESSAKLHADRGKTLSNLAGSDASSSSSGPHLISHRGSSSSIASLSGTSSAVNSASNSGSIPSRNVALGRGSSYEEELEERLSSVHVSAQMWRERAELERRRRRETMEAARAQERNYHTAIDNLREQETAKFERLKSRARVLMRRCEQLRGERAQLEKSLVLATRNHTGEIRAYDEKLAGCADELEREKSEKSELARIFEKVKIEIAELKRQLGREISEKHELAEQVDRMQLEKKELINNLPRQLLTVAADEKMQCHSGESLEMWCNFYKSLFEMTISKVKQIECVQSEALRKRTAARSRRRRRLRQGDGNTGRVSFSDTKAVLSFQPWSEYDILKSASWPCLFSPNVKKQERRWNLSDSHVTIPAFKIGRSFDSCKTVAQGCKSLAENEGAMLDNNQSKSNDRSRFSLDEDAEVWHSRQSSVVERCSFDRMPRWTSKISITEFVDKSTDDKTRQTKDGGCNNAEVLRWIDILLEKLSTDVPISSYAQPATITDVKQPATETTSLLNLYSPLAATSVSAAAAAVAVPKSNMATVASGTAFVANNAATFDKSAKPGKPNPISSYKSSSTESSKGRPSKPHRRMVGIPRLELLRRIQRLGLATDSSAAGTEVVADTHWESEYRDESFFSPRQHRSVDDNFNRDDDDNVNSESVASEVFSKSPASSPTFKEPSNQQQQLSQSSQSSFERLRHRRNGLTDIKDVQVRLAGSGIGSSSGSKLDQIAMRVKARLH